MLKALSKRLVPTFTTAKQQYSRHFIVRIHFGVDGFYQSNQYRPDFVKMLTDLQKQNKAIILGGDSFPFKASTFYINCDEVQIAQKFAKENVYVAKGIAKATLQQSERVSSHKIGNIANFYQIKTEV